MYARPRMVLSDDSGADLKSYAAGEEKGYKRGHEAGFVKGAFLGVLAAGSAVAAYVFGKNKYNKPLKHVAATKSVASIGLANARRLAGRYELLPNKESL